MRAAILVMVVLAGCAPRAPQPAALIDMPPVNTRPPPDEGPRTALEQARIDHVVDGIITSHARLCGTIGSAEFKAAMEALMAMPSRLALIGRLDMLRLHTRAMERARAEPSTDCPINALLYRDVRGRIAADRPRTTRPASAPAKPATPDTGWRPAAPEPAPAPAPPPKAETLDL